MTNLIATVILALIVGGAVFYIIRAKKSGAKCIGCPAGGSCSGSHSPAKKKLEGPVIRKRTLAIDGMHCEHCAVGVTQSLNRIDGVSAQVNLSRGKAIVSCDREIDDSILKNAVEKAGYHVTSIS